MGTKTKKIAVLSVLLLTGCSSSPANVKDCLGDSERALCIEHNVQNIADGKVRMCVEDNIGQDSELSGRMQTNMVTDDDVRTIDTLARTCMSYVDANPTSSQDFTSPFLMGMLGGYLGSQVFGAPYGAMTNYNQPGFVREEVGKKNKASSGVVPATTMIPKGSGSYRLGDTGAKWGATSSKYSSSKGTTVKSSATRASTGSSSLG